MRQLIDIFPKGVPEISLFFLEKKTDEREEFLFFKVPHRQRMEKNGVE